MRSVIALLMHVYVRSGESLESRIEAETLAAMRNFYRLHPEEFIESIVDIALGDKPFQVNARHHMGRFHANANANYILCSRTRLPL